MENRNLDHDMQTADAFQKNIERWSLFCPEAAAKLPSLDVQGVSIKDDLMQIVDDGTVFNCQDPENPLSEAKECLDKAAIKGKNILFIWGLGSGYFYDVLRDWLNESPKHQMVFLERDLRVIKCLLQTEKGAQILFDKQVWLYHIDRESKLFDALTDLFVIQPWSFVVLPRYHEKYSMIVQQDKAKLNFLLNLKFNSTHEYLNYGEGYFQNFFRNLSLLPESILGSKLYHQFAGKPAIICGAGPSLKKNLHILESLKDHAIIFAGGTAMNAVNANGFLPHFGVGIDPNIDQFTRLITNTAFMTPYFYKNRFLNEGLHLIHGEHIYIPGSGGYAITPWLEEQLGIKASEVSEGCNVINLSLSIAAELGCNPIIFVGVDLAYTDEEPYAAGIINHPLYGKREFMRTKNIEEDLIVRTDINGQAVYTLWKWMMESFWFSNFATQHPNIRLINATEGGIGFLGIPNMTLSEARDLFLTTQYDFSGLIHALLQQSKMPRAVSRIRIEELINEMKASLEESLELIVSIHSGFRKLAEDEKMGNPLPEDLLTQKAKEEIALFHEKLAYRHFLFVFDEAFSRVVKKELLRLETDKEFFTPEQLQEKHLVLLARRYQFLIETVKANLYQLEKGFKELTQRTELLNSLPPSPHESFKPRIRSSSIESIDGINDADRQKHSIKTPGSSVYSEYTTTCHELDGLYSHFDENGRLLAQSNFLHGKRQGSSVYFHANGESAATLNFNEGLFQGLQEYFFSNGSKKAVLSYEKGILNGVVRLYTLFGRLRREVFFKDGKHEGWDRLWNEEGMLIIEAQYKDNLPSETVKQWYKNGTLAVEKTFDSNGHLMATSKWDENGQPILDECDGRDDYFDKVTKQTGVITTSLEEVVKQLSGVAPLIANNLEKGDDNTFVSIAGEIEALKKEMEKLKDINLHLLKEAGLDPTDHKEPLWKSPSSRNEIELHIEEKAAAMSSELAAIQQALANTLGTLLKPPERD